MAIYVDTAFILWRGRQWCHLFTDEPIDVLHSFAARIGIRRAWFQDKTHPHYDVTDTIRERAIANGAMEIDWRSPDYPRLLAVIAARKRGG